MTKAKSKVSSPSPSAQSALRRPYSRVLVADPETGRFSAQIVEFSGCFADGATAEEAARNLERAAAAWVTAALARGHPLPEPVGDTEFSGKLVLRLPRSLHQRCSIYAQQEGVSLNQFLSCAVAEHLGERRAADSTTERLAALLSASPLATRDLLEHVLVNTSLPMKTGDTSAALPPLLN